MDNNNGVKIKNTSDVKGVLFYRATSVLQGSDILPIIPITAMIY
jgi:hypothetical protein